MFITIQHRLSVVSLRRFISWFETESSHNRESHCITELLHEHLLLRNLPPPCCLFDSADNSDMILIRDLFPGKVTTNRPIATVTCPAHRHHLFRHQLTHRSNTPSRYRIMTELGMPLRPKESKKGKKNRRREEKYLFEQQLKKIEWVSSRRTKMMIHHIFIV